MDKKLAAAIQRDNELEDAGMHGDDRKTCWTHQSWAEDCDDLHIKRDLNGSPRPA
ncbi:hypothetical protein ACFYZ9_21500 [Streptomyces sp. NPDC001691]|uniref:hypothetical protein n=1 Tax=Streptomyces sp. NPDC001691 TaxID=3364600 RepID=UPI00368AD6C1